MNLASMNHTLRETGHILLIAVILKIFAHIINRNI